MEVPESCKGVARFTFEYLCGRPVGAADYIAVAKNYHTIFISEIPAMSMEIRDKVKYFKIPKIKVYGGFLGFFSLMGFCVGVVRHVGL